MTQTIVINKMLSLNRSMSSIFRSLKTQLLFVGLVSSMLMSVMASADGQIHHMSLSHHEFEKWTFTPQMNDEVVIENRSDITHSIYITHADGTVENLGVQLPGKTVTWKVTQAGEYLFQCWIHPIIRARMTVQETASSKTQEAGDDER